MANVAAIQQKAAQELQQKRHRMQMKKVRTENDKTYQAAAKEGEENLARLHKEYTARFSREKNELERKLRDIRIVYGDRIRQENDRYQSEIDDLKSAHEQQVGELKASQEQEIARISKEQASFVENARLKFEEQRAKYES